MSSKWTTPKGMHNSILESEDGSFFISYNPDTANMDGAPAIAELAQTFGEILGLEKRGGEETALVKREADRNVYKILKGDFRKQYEFLMDMGYGACEKFFDQHKDEYGSSWSTLEEDR